MTLGPPPDPTPTQPLDAAPDRRLGPGSRYTLAEDRVLTGLWQAHVPVRQIAARLGRSVESVYLRGSMLGLPRGVEERWRARRRERAQAMQKRRAQMLKLRAAGATPQQIADRFNLTSRHVQQILKAPSP